MLGVNENRDFTDAVIFRDDLLDIAIEFIINKFDPEDIFRQEQLEKWAEKNGYSKAAD